MSGPAFPHLFSPLRLGTVGPMVFGCLDPAAPSLEEWVGDLAPSLERAQVFEMDLPGDVAEVGRELGGVVVCIEKLVDQRGNSGGGCRLTNVIGH